jgi:hypothetical protein
VCRVCLLTSPEAINVHLREMASRMTGRRQALAAIPAVCLKRTVLAGMPMAGAVGPGPWWERSSVGF